MAIEWYNRGVRLNDNSDKEMACYLEAIKADPTFAPAYYNLAYIFYQRNNIPKAIENFEKYMLYTQDEAEKAKVKKILEQLETLAGTSSQ